MKIFKTIFAPFLTLIASPVVAIETDPLGGESTASINPPKLSKLFSVGGPLDNIFTIIFPLAGLICVIFIIIGGYMWISAAGDPSRVKTAQNTLTWAIIGLVVVLLAVAVIEVITKFIS